MSNSSPTYVERGFQKHYPGPVGLGSTVAPHLQVQSALASDLDDP